MAFSSAAFGLFLLLTLAACRLSPLKYRVAVLLGLSLLYYASWSLMYAGTLLALVIGVYAATLRGSRSFADAPARPLFAAIVSGLLALLALFKAGETVGSVDGAYCIAIPLGLSYVVFKLLSYVLDVYWERMAAEPNTNRLALSALFFPQIVSGPIHRPRHFLQCIPDINVTRGSVEAGARLVLLGFAKKLTADLFAPLVAEVHRAPTSFSSAILLLAAYCFSFQLYLDFSGLTDLAVGMGHMLGVKAPENFNLPFFSRNVQEFWRRWHISLTEWLSDYLFTPLRMALRQYGQLGLSVAIIANMVAIGLWHGPRLTYLVFGLINGIFMLVSVMTLKHRNQFLARPKALRPLRAVFSRLCTFHLITLSFVIFRAESLNAALLYLGGIFSFGAGPDWIALEAFSNGEAAGAAAGFLGLIGIEIMNARYRRPEIGPFREKLAATFPELVWIPKPLQGSLTAIATGIIVYFLIGRGVSQQFIYAQF